LLVELHDPFDIGRLLSPDGPLHPYASDRHSAVGAVPFCPDVVLNDSQAGLVDGRAATGEEPRAGLVLNANHVNLSQRVCEVNFASGTVC